MEEIGILVGFALVVAAIVVPIWLIVTVVNLRRRAEVETQENTRHWQDLTARVHLLETQLKELKQTPAETRPTPEAPKPAAASTPLPANPLTRAESDDGNRV